MIWNERQAGVWATPDEKRLIYRQEDGFYLVVYTPNDSIPDVYRVETLEEAKSYLT